MLVTSLRKTHLVSETKSKGKVVGNAISEFQKLSLSKQEQVQNLCCEN